MLEVRDLVKSFEDKPLLQSLNFTVGDAETVCLLGESGTGKSTLLQIIAGLEMPDSGNIFFDGLDLADTSPHLRNFGLVFQDYALFPHLNVNDNVAFGLKMRRLGRAETSERVAASLDLVSLNGFGERHVGDLSGGEQQRVALARALAIRPRLLLLDEPLGALDRSLRAGLLSELRTILRRARIPAIYVTHDQEEAFSIADRVMILNEGRIVRDGTPTAVWADPQSAYVAIFFGLGNVVVGEAEGAGRFNTEHGNFDVNCDHVHSKGDRVNLLVRPLSAGKERNQVHGTVADVIFQQDRYRVTLESGLYVYLQDAVRVGQPVSASVKVECLA